ncbi:hypothetical protein J5N97_007631 [Dioscorea zingiberensis]|uniref:WRKY domain-containing protein n=1 Tax=Dioscorea zingiberensis TaxID=325984 RepID=A0A9D5DEM3_9LILI|nr:hypothetical protein J5N97_007631 [Dioscorea zingiberensis]
MEGDDWDLEAVVRSCRSTGTTSAAATRDALSSSSYSSFPMKEEMVFGDGTGFPGLVVSSNDGVLEELCKPFISKPQQELQALCSSSSSSHPAQQRPRPVQHRPVSQIPRSKRRKNQQKKVVCHVPADGLASDVWAWRKYGQKPIKGSPYPRGYYRCSSSKGCQARKQVERSRADPGVLIITYTAEHNHPVPTHRNSLAGSTRAKFSPTAAAAADATPVSPPTFTAGMSPTTPLTASMEEEEEGELLVEDMEMMGDDELVFMGFEEGVAAEDGVSGFFEEEEDQVFPTPWLANGHNAAAAAGGAVIGRS